MLEEEDEDELEEEDEEMEALKQGGSLMKGNEASGNSNTSNAESSSDSEMASVLGNVNQETGCCYDVAQRQIFNLSPGNDIQCDDREANVEFKKSESISLLGENGDSCDEKESSIEFKKEISLALASKEEHNLSDEKESSFEFKKEISFALTSKEEQSLTCSNLVVVREPNVELKTEEPSSSSGENNSCDQKEATSGSTSVITNECGEMGSICDSKTSVEGLLNFEEFNTPKDIEVLGLERLKNELQSRGLKCGGSLSERAARLFLLKTTPLEELSKKHFAMAKSVGK
ncbi:hypothetical protein KI387_038141 [Taxus chinensis]|uniref:SDE2/SF3A3 SAP domain-containing protein n=1 Tax=Taxus chinensis TaxID=29808 RepID=A0AA38FUH3_TAXCH|nr:hypothetical protein KI387_038141 [Taxus chinensis]